VSNIQEPLALVTGATGYVGGRLAPMLLTEGFRVRALVRSASKLQGSPWANQVDICEGDAFDEQSLARALSGVSVAYYLIKS
jgi:uncharacterized protein YbjT (DUF2867 family)